MGLHVYVAFVLGARRPQRMYFLACDCLSSLSAQHLQNDSFGSNAHETLPAWLADIFF